MIRKILEECPSCGGGLEIGEVHCTVCETQVHARYRPCDFCSLTDEQSTFLRLFVLSRGNLTEVEKRLGVSYPTVRAKLDEVIERLNTEASAPRPEQPAQRAEPPAAGGGRRQPTARGRDQSDPPPPEMPAPQPPDPTLAERRRILAAVARGEISAEDGMNSIRALGANHADEGRGADDGSA